MEISNKERLRFCSIGVKRNQNKIQQVVDEADVPYQMWGEMGMRNVGSG